MKSKVPLHSILSYECQALGAAFQVGLAKAFRTFTQHNVVRHGDL